MPAALLFVHADYLGIFLKSTSFTTDMQHLNLPQFHVSINAKHHSYIFLDTHSFRTCPKKRDNYKLL